MAAPGSVDGAAAGAAAGPPAPAARARWLGKRVLGWFRSADVALVPLVFGLALQLRAWLTWRPLWLDEQMIARNIRDRGFAGLATVLDHNQAAPIGWLWAERVVVEVAGNGERALRFVPFLFAAGSLVLAWLAVRRLFGPMGSFVTVAFFAVNSYLLRYAAETKQYTGDVFWVLLMIVVGRWVLAAPRPRRFVVWWSVAALASLFSMGAILAMPALALVLVGAAWWRGRWRLTWWVSLPALLWLAAFLPHYWLSMRPLLANEMMAQFWSERGYPPADAGVFGTLGWASHRLEVLAREPLGLDAAGLGREWLDFAGNVFWLLALIGVLVAMRRTRGGGVPMGLLLAVPVISAFVLAILRVSPLYMRLAMWIMPGLFLAVGFAVDAAARLVVRAWVPPPVTVVASSAGSGAIRPGGNRSGVGRARGTWRRGGWSRWAAALVGAATVLVAAVAFAPLPAAAVRLQLPIRFDYRGAVHWLVAQHRPGDLTVVVDGGQHAVAWYDPAGRITPATWVRVTGKKEPCDRAALRHRLAGFRRVLFYADLRDRPSIQAADAVSALLDRLGGEVVATGYFGSRGVVSAIDLPTDQEIVDVPDGVDPDPELPGKAQPCLQIVK